MFNNTTQQANLSEPTISVTVNSEMVQNGSRITTGEDPRLTVQVQSNRHLESVLIRIDGQTHQTYSPNTTTFSTTTTLDLQDGGHRVTVIAVANTTTAHSVTIVEDAIGPRINFQEPFTTTGFQPPEQNYTLSTSNITLRGQLIDRSSVQRVIITHRYEYTFNGEKTERSRYVIDEPGESFAQQLKLGPNQKNQTNGTNYITVETVDAKDNDRKYAFVLNISDTEPPDIAILDTTPLYEESTVALKFHVTDNVGISRFGRRLGSGNMTGFHSYYSENDIYQHRNEYTTTVELPTSLARNGVTFVAADIVDNNATLNHSLAYEEFVRPRIALDTDATRIIGDQTARVSGTIHQGRFSHAEIEVRTSEGTLSDIIVLQAGETTSHIEFNKSMQVDSYPATIQVRVQDVTGTEYIEDYQLTREDPQQTSQPTPNVLTSTPVPPQPETKTTISPTSTTASQYTTTVAESTKSPTEPQQSSLFDSIVGYLIAILPYTLGSAIFTVVLYIIARKILAR
jgi:hypothetical protein